MSGLEILVVGASIAGPTTAYWMAKAEAKVTVIKHFPRLRTAGQVVDIRTAGVSVMRKMLGMEAEVRAKSTLEEGISLVREDGRPYGTIRATGNPDQQPLVSKNEIFRGHLANILFDLTKSNENIKFIFGEQIASMQQSKSGKGPITDLLQGSKMGQGYSAVRGRFISIGPNPSGSSRVMLRSICPRDKGDITLPFCQASIQGDDVLRKYITQHYEGAGQKSKSLLQQMMGSKDIHASEVVQVNISSSLRGRFVLVGDAGYATGPIGNGTSLAITGAYMLAGEVSKHTGELAPVLRGYERQMKPMIREMQKIPPLINTPPAPQTTSGVWLRNHAFAFIAWTRVIEFAQKYIGSACASSETFPLPDYEWVA